ncbi:MAG: GIY-YIG nuclease family protein [Chloroflexales bacterium]|nr:GIY-YIG nuclease family protein [Chloroflexales bacterium]
MRAVTEIGIYPAIPLHLARWPEDVKASIVKGTYLLVLHLATNLQQLSIGRLGVFDFAAGYYLYVGSAFGSGGLAARLAYHQRSEKTHPHWHIDYLRPYLQLIEAWTIGGTEPIECFWCTKLTQIIDLQAPIRKFGSRDTNCYSHLFYSTTRPNIHLLAHTLLANLPFYGPTMQKLLIEIHLFDEQ